MKEENQINRKSIKEIEAAIDRMIGTEDSVEFIEPTVSFFETLNEVKKHGGGSQSPHGNRGGKHAAGGRAHVASGSGKPTGGDPNPKRVGDPKGEGKKVPTGGGGSTSGDGVKEDSKPSGGGKMTVGEAMNTLEPGDTVRVTDRGKSYEGTVTENKRGRGGKADQIAIQPDGTKNNFEQRAYVPSDYKRGVKFERVGKAPSSMGSQALKMREAGLKTSGSSLSSRKIDSAMKHPAAGNTTLLVRTTDSVGKISPFHVSTRDVKLDGSFNDAVFSGIVRNGGSPHSSKVEVKIDDVWYAVD